MEIFKQFGSFFGGESAPGPSPEDERVKDRENKIKRLEELKRNREEIKKWIRAGERAPADTTRLTQLDGQIELLERELEEEK